MARKTSRTHAQGEASRRSILESTVRIAGERGYVGATMAQIVKASGLPASSVYWHFNSKDDLLADAIEHGFRTWEAVEPQLARHRRAAHGRPDLSTSSASPPSRPAMTRASGGWDCCSPSRPDPPSDRHRATASSRSARTPSACCDPGGVPRWRRPATSRRRTRTLSRCSPSPCSTAPTCPASLDLRGTVRRSCALLANGLAAAARHPGSRETHRARHRRPGPVGRNRRRATRVVPSCSARLPRSPPRAATKARPSRGSPSGQACR